MTWKEVIKKTEGYLRAKAVPDERVVSELLAARLLRVGRGFLSKSIRSEVSEPQLEAMRRAMTRLAGGEPLQYVLGEWDFRMLTLKCDRRALIPRPETEELVSRVLARLKKLPSDVEPVIIDIGTGTGAIALSLAAEFKRGTIIGTDISEEAIELARENAIRCSLEKRVQFVAMDGLDEFDEPECVDIIVSNPPYIESSVCETLDKRVRDFEPRIALDGGADGLNFYRRYLGDALNVLKPNGAVFFEIGENQRDSVSQLMRDYGFGEIKVEKDYAGHWRYASATLS